MSLRKINIKDRELLPLQKVFPDINENNFRKLKNGNHCIQVSFITTGKYACGMFDILIEYPHNYPISAPKVWIQKPIIPRKTPHIYERDKHGHALICYLRPKKDWHHSYSSYETAMMVETWLTSYCKWKKTGKWDFPEAGFWDHMI